MLCIICRAVALTKLPFKFPARWRLENQGYTGKGGDSEAVAVVEMKRVRHLDFSPPE
jgi:hypothetical protein